MAKGDSFDRELRQLGDEFTKESDRAIVIIAAARMDQFLERIAANALIPCASSNDDLFEGENAPLGTFSSRIRICHRLGLIDVEFASALHTVRRLRNDFAHESGTLALDEGPCRDRANHLVTPFRRRPFFQKLVLPADDNPFRDRPEFVREFLCVLLLIVGKLHLLAERGTRLAHSQPAVMIPTRLRSEAPELPNSGNGESAPEKR